MTLDRTDRDLLNCLQQGLPLVRELWAALGNALCISEQDILRRTERLKEDGLIRRLSGFFNGGALGYTSVLCALELPPERVKEAAELLDAVPGVTHNYLRDHRLNLWFTLSCRNLAEQDRILCRIEERGWTVHRFRRTAQYKIRAVFDMREDNCVGAASGGVSSGGGISGGVSSDGVTLGGGIPDGGTSCGGTSSGGSSCGVLSSGTGGAVHRAGRTTDFGGTITQREIRLIRLLQEDFPVCSRPFAMLGERLDIPEDEVLAAANALQQEGKLRRIAAALRHHRAGYGANSMVVWDVPEERLASAAEAVVPLPQVTHCYARERDPEFDFNFYTMVHASTEEGLAGLIHKMEALIQPVKFSSLNTLRELKKIGMKYFAQEADCAEEMNCAKETGCTERTDFPLHRDSVEEADCEKRTDCVKEADLELQSDCVREAGFELQSDCEKEAGSELQTDKAEEREALILIGHGPADGPGTSYLTLREEFRAAHPETWLILLRGEPSAERVLPELVRRGVRRARLFPLLLTSSVHFSRDLSAADSPLRQAFAEAGIETRLISGGLLEAPEIRRAVRDYCESRMNGPG